MNQHAPPPPVCRASYNQSLSKTVGSKLFFVDKLPMHEVTRFVDIGCADGAVLKALHRAYPDADYVGIDKYVSQCGAAKQNFPEGTFLTSAGMLPAYPASERKRTVLILSSVLHEVFSDPAIVWSDWWQEVENLGCGYIVIRDMALPEWVYGKDTSLDWYAGFMTWALGDFKRLAQMREFIACFGSLRFLHNFMHFLLKYPYRENWERELREDYVKHSHESLVDILTQRSYRATHINPTSTKHFQERVLRDFGIDVGAIQTHVELVLQRRAPWPQIK